MNAKRIIEQLYDWQSPRTMQDRVERLANLLGNDAMQRRGKAFREAFVAARFAMTTRHESVRLLREDGSESTPDFAVSTGSGELNYETTEADIPGRKRQLEYREPQPAGVEPMVFTSLDRMVEQMRTVTAKKASKVYAECAGLVVHLNPPAFSFNPEFRTESMRLATEPAARAFEEVWLLRDRGCLLWRRGVFQGWLPDDF